MMHLTIKEAAEYLGVSVALVYQFCEERRLRHYRYGGEGRRGKIVIREDDLRAFQEQCRVDQHPLLEALP
jgi:excisionase family DNA binding protein